MSETDSNITINAKDIPLPFLVALDKILYEPNSFIPAGERHQIITGLVNGGENSIFRKMPKLPIEVSRSLLAELIKQFRTFLRGPEFEFATNKIQSELFAVRTKQNLVLKDSTLVARFKLEPEERKVELSPEIQSQVEEMTRINEVRDKIDQGNIVDSLSAKYQLGPEMIEFVGETMQCMQPAKLPLGACINCYYGFVRAKALDEFGNRIERNAGSSLEGCNIARTILTQHAQEVDAFEAAYLKEIKE